jgi:redox-sensitive bicupin YhaK (pirin superfamily)
MPTQVIRASERYHHETDWLSTYWHFSFDRYYDPANVSFGPLRVFNDDVVRPASGFPPHPHRDMEIVSYVLEGRLDHQDDRGNQGAIAAGELQVMSAGRGITHAELNRSATDPVHFLQVWIVPRTRGLPPRWEQHAVAPAATEGRLLPVVSGTGTDGTLRIDQDATMYVARLAPGQAVTHRLARGRRAYLFVIGGEAIVDAERLSAGDQARITGVDRLTIEAGTATHLMLIDLP